MDGPSGTLKVYQEKVGALLTEAKAQLEMLEAQAKVKKAEAEIAAINALKNTHQQIDRKRRDLEKSAEPKVAQLKADLDAQVAGFKTSLEQLSTKIKLQSRSR